MLAPSPNQAHDGLHKSVYSQGDMLHNIPCLVLIKIITERMQKSFVITLQITEILANGIWL